MDYVRLGTTGIEVSPICLGCMTYGDPARGNHAWSLPEDQARPFFAQALDAGINFFDTANVYSDGSSEEITGRALAEYTRRDEVVIATKVNGRMRPGTERPGAFPQGDPDRHRRVPDPAGHRLRGAVPDPPVRPVGPGRGDDGGAARRRPGGQGALSRGVVDVDLAVREDAARRRPARLDPVRHHAEPLQPAGPRGGAGDAAVLPRLRRRRDPVEPAGPRPA